MEKEKKFEPDNPEQSAQFIEIAERIQEEGAEERFEEAMKRVLTAKRKDASDEATNSHNSARKP